MKTNSSKHTYSPFGKPLVSLFLTVVNMLTFTLPSFGQHKQAPKINITNKFDDSFSLDMLEDKVLVLEFWATWCAPCLASIPHLNELQKHYVDNKNIVFLSMTDEKPNKVEPILKRFDFKSYVVADTTGTTLSNFAVTHLPTLFIIDEQGYIKFNGSPQEVTSGLIDSILMKNKLPESLSQQAKNTEKSATNTDYEKIRNSYDKLSKVFFNDSISSYFEMFVSPKDNFKKKNSTTSKTSFRIFETNVDLDLTISKLLGCGLNQVNLPDNLKKTNINYCFKTSDVQNINVDFLDNILNGLNLSIDSIKSTYPELLIKIIDTELLQAATNKSNNPYMKTSVADNGTILAIHNNKLESLIAELERKFGMKVNICNFDNVALDSTYDITLKSSTIESLNESLAFYGLSIRDVMTNGVTYLIHDKH